MIQTLAFYLFATLLIASAVFVILARNPVHSVLWLIVAFFNAAGLILLVAMIGAIVLTHRQRSDVRSQNVSRQNQRRPQDATRNTRPGVGEGVVL